MTLRGELGIGVLCATLCLSTCSLAAAEVKSTVLLVVGAAGAKEFEPQFREWADRWQSYASNTGADLVTIGLDDAADQPDRDRLRQAILSLSAPSEDSPGSLILAMIGHGTHFRGVSKFNLRGPDVGDDELAEWLSSVTLPVAVVQCSSASGPFLPTLSGNQRIVITATRSGTEQNFARFGDYFSSALTDPLSDLDHDRTISLLEAFLFASARVESYYDENSRLATEHSLLDDNGDKRGTSAKSFRGIRAQFAANDQTPVDGLRAHQFILFHLPGQASLSDESLLKRDELERQIEALRGQKAELTENDYFERLEPLMIELARLYAASEKAQTESAARSK